MTKFKNRTKRIDFDERNKDALRQMYDGLLALEGFIKDNISDTSTTIDEVLYGNWEAEQEGK